MSLDTENKNPETDTTASPEPMVKAGAETEDLPEEDLTDLLASGTRDESSRDVVQVKTTFKTFEEANFHPDLLKAISDKGWTAPTPVQSMCLPFTLKNKDVAGFAQTGTGKTGVFLMTLGEKFLRKKDKEVAKGKIKPLSIILAPTRELAIQIEDDIEGILKALGIKSMAVFGGMDWEKQANQLKQGVEVIVATPGRLIDFSKKGLLDLSDLMIFVCDEVDRMFDMGFIEDVEFFLDKIPEKCQRLIFSATTNDNVNEVAFEYLNNPEYVYANPEVIAPEKIEQHAIHCETKNKLFVLLGLLRDHKPQRAIIFANTKLTATWLHYKLSRNGLDCDVITGDLPQNKRIRLIKRIKEGKVKVLIGTDVASRGIHITGVTHVYNFDLPDESANYVHRIGRTARAGAEGSSYSLVCDEYGRNFEAIKSHLGEACPESKWYDKSYLEIEDKAGNPFKDNFGVKKPEPRKARGPKDRNKPNDRKSRQGERTRKDKDQQNKGRKPQHKHQKPRKEAVVQEQSTSFFGMIKKLFKIIFGIK